MFDVIKIGRTISKLRQQNNMTQAELADQLGISFQAVSNWERGVSSPDIAKLTELSEIFQVPIDDILVSQRTTQIIHNVKKQQVMEDITPEEIEEIGPLLHTEEAERLVEGVAEFSLRDLARVAPFISTDRVDQLFLRLRSQVKHLRELVALAPFVSQKVLDEIVLEAVEEDTAYSRKDIVALAPFTSTAVLDKIFLATTERYASVRELVALAPFVSGQVLETGIQKILEGSDKDQQFSDFIALAPFVSKEFLETVVFPGKDTPRTVKEISAVLPFLGQETLNKFVDSIVDSVLSEESPRTGEQTKQTAKAPISDVTSFVQLAQVAAISPREQVDVTLQFLTQQNAPLESISILAGIAPFAGPKALEETLTHLINTQGNQYEWEELQILSGFIDTDDFEELFDQWDD